MTHKCELIERSAQPTLSIRTRAAVQDIPKVLGPAYGKIMQHMGELGGTPGGAPFVAYYNMDMQDLDMEIGFPVLSTLPGRAEVAGRANPRRQGSQLPAHRAVSRDSLRIQRPLRLDHSPRPPPHRRRLRVLPQRP